MCTPHPKRKTHLSRHHIISRHRGGKSTPSNCIKLFYDRHCCWHYIFGHATFTEAVADIKRYHFHYGHKSEWKMLFHELSLPEVVRLIERTSKIKHSLKKRWH
jgi:hypothetical protein